MRLFTKLLKVMLINNNTYVPAFFFGCVLFILMLLFMLHNLISQFVFHGFDTTSLFTENPLFVENPFLPQFNGVFELSGATSDSPTLFSCAPSTQLTDEQRTAETR